MSGAQIAAEISAALREVAAEVGDGVFIVTLKPQTTQETPWDAPEAGITPIELAAIDDGIREIYVQGSQATRQARVVTVEALGGVVPAVGDKLTVKDRDHAILSVMPLSPSGTDLLYDVELSL